MPRYRLLLEYDGGPYHGFQAQGDLPSVQASVERAIAAFASVPAAVCVGRSTFQPSTAGSADFAAIAWNTSSAAASA